MRIVVAAPCRVTVDCVAHPVGKPFLVIATQNPVEQSGTFELPEAQLDRFMLNIRVNYPTEAEEIEIVSRTTSSGLAEPEPVLTASDILRMQALVRDIPVARIAARLPQGGSVDVCTTQATDPVTSMPRETSVECGAGSQWNSRRISTGNFPAASAAGSGKRAKSAGVTMFTRTSVHWADKIVAMRSSSGLLKFNVKRQALIRQQSSREARPSRQMPSRGSVGTSQTRSPSDSINCRTPK